MNTGEESAELLMKMMLNGTEVPCYHKNFKIVFWNYFFSFDGGLSFK